MTMEGRYFYGTTPIDYDQAKIAEVNARFLGDGYIPYLTNESLLRVYQAVSPNMSVLVESGGVSIQGYHGFNGGFTTLAIEAADVSNPRIDRVVARLTRSGIDPGTLELAILKGEAQNPAVAPTPTYVPGSSAAIYELVIADLLIPANTTTITTAMITDQRNNDLLCGPARPHAVGKQAYADIIMNGFRLTGMANPSAAQDADTLVARDAAILVAVPAQAGNSTKFLSTNGSGTYWAAQGQIFRAVASDTLVASSDVAVGISEGGYTLKKVIVTPLVHMAGGVYRVKFSLTINQAGDCYGKIYVNNIATGTERHFVSGGTFGGTQEYSEDITVSGAGGAQIQIYCYTAIAGAAVLNFRVYCTESIPWT
jgi:hypothetical protein